MPDDIRINGAPNTDAVGWIRHLIEESKRLGEHVREEGRDTQRRFDELRSEVNICQSEIKAQIAELQTRQAVSDKEMKIRIAGLSAAVSAIVSIALAILKLGIIG